MSGDGGVRERGKRCARLGCATSGALKGPSRMQIMEWVCDQLRNDDPQDRVSAAAELVRLKAEVPRLDQLLPANDHYDRVAAETDPDLLG